MKYVSTAQWRDLEDKHIYGVGEEFPFDGREVPESRIEELSCPQNKAGFAVIKAVDEPKPVEEEETPKKATRSRKKAE